MELFDISNNKLTFSPQALALKPFKVLWDRDSSQDKEQAVKQLAFVYYFSDFKSDFADIVDEEQRAQEIKSVIECDVDKEVLEACKFYCKMRETLITDSLLAAREALFKVKQYFRSVDFEQVNARTGLPIHKVGDVMKAIENLGSSIEGLENLEEKVKKEKEASGRMKGTKEKKTFEDGA